MEQITDKIIQLFKGFEFLTFQIDKEFKSVANIDFEALDYTLYNEVSEIEGQLRKAFLMGNDLLFIRVRNELLKIKEVLNEVDFGLVLRVMPEEIELNIGPEFIISINKIKLNHLEGLIKFIDSFITPHENEEQAGKKHVTFINKFDTISEAEIYGHFKDGLVAKGYITEDELNDYLKAAFELKTKPRTLFKIKDAPIKQK